jgi:hypothetical protein
MRFLIWAAALPLLAQNPVTDVVRSNYERLKRDMIETAELMPANDYDYRLTPPQRPFSGWIEHTAMGNYRMCSMMAGQAEPDAMKGLHGLSQKDEIVKALRDSFAYCDKELGEMNDGKAVANIEFDGRKYPAVQVMIGLVASLSEHYGNLVGYLRSKGIEPPSTAHASKKK